MDMYNQYTNRAMTNHMIGDCWENDPKNDLVNLPNDPVELENSLYERQNSF
jgi:hypothetical protein